MHSEQGAKCGLSMLLVLTCCISAHSFSPKMSSFEDVFPSLFKTNATSVKLFLNVYFVTQGRSSNKKERKKERMKEGRKDGKEGNITSYLPQMLVRSVCIFGSL